MKNIIYSVCIVLLVTGCQSNDKNLNENICGIYTRSFVQEYASGNDTLAISELNNANSIYKIEHHTSYVQLMDGIAQPRKFLSETWTATYHADTKQLVEQRKGKSFSFSAKYDCLFLGINKYDKIK